MVIIDPGIKVETGYTPYEDGVKMDIFIKVCTYILYTIYNKTFCTHVHVHTCIAYQEFFMVRKKFVEKISLSLISWTAFLN